MLKFISFGSGSSGNCYYLGTATDGLIIDIGIGIRTLKKYCREYGIQLNSVKRILITHDHADHIKSVGALSHDCNLPVYATHKVHQGIDQNYCVTKKVSQDHKHELVIGEQVQLGDFKVRPFAVPHDASEKVGYELEVENEDYLDAEDFRAWVEENADSLAQEDAAANGTTFEGIEDIDYETEWIDDDALFDADYEAACESEWEWMTGR